MRTGGMDFEAEVAKLPEVVRNHLTAAGLTDASLVADSATPSAVQDADGKTVHKSVDIVFLEAISAAVPDVKPATGHWARTLRFFRTCWHETHRTEPAAAPERPRPSRQRMRARRNTTNWTRIRGRSGLTLW